MDTVEYDACLTGNLDGVIFALNKIGGNPFKTKAHEVKFSYETNTIGDEIRLEIFFKRSVDSERIRIIMMASSIENIGQLFDGAAEKLMTYMMWAKDYESDDKHGFIRVYSKDTIFSKDLDLILN